MTKLVWTGDVRRHIRHKLILQRVVATAHGGLVTLHRIAFQEPVKFLQWAARCSLPATTRKILDPGATECVRRTHPTRYHQCYERDRLGHN